MKKPYKFAEWLQQHWEAHSFSIGPAPGGFVITIHDNGDRVGGGYLNYAEANEVELK